MYVCNYRGITSFHESIMLSSDILNKKNICANNFVLLLSMETVISSSKTGKKGWICSCLSFYGKETNSDATCNLPWMVSGITTSLEIHYNYSVCTTHIEYMKFGDLKVSCVSRSLNQMRRRKMISGHESLFSKAMI